MYSLLIELAGPMQAWGSRSRFSTRATERAPTRSGVIGLVAAALGVQRTESLARFDGLRYGVRVDQPGQVERDFQTARSLDGQTSMPLSDRYYLADAVFVAALEAETREDLVEIQEALRMPRFPLYLGRRAFPPAGPLSTEIVQKPLRKALAEHPWRASTRYQKDADKPPRVDVLVDATPGEQAHLSLQDIPRSFDSRRRLYDWRDVTVLSIELPGVESADSDRGHPAIELPEHDALALVSEEEV